MTPLNLYLCAGRRPSRRSAVIDYGQTHPRPRLDQHLPRRPAAQELRRHPPRPRDLLRLRRALPLSRLPLPRDARAGGRRGGDERRALVLRGDNDVFPETFLKFLGFQGELGEVFLAKHGEILEAGVLAADAAADRRGGAGRHLPHAASRRLPG